MSLHESNSGKSGNSLKSDEQYLDAIEDLELRIRSIKRGGFLLVFLILGLVALCFVPFYPIMITSSVLLIILCVIFIIGGTTICLEYNDTSKEFRNPWNRLRIVRREYGRFVVRYMNDDK